MPAPRRRVERELLAAAEDAGVAVDWQRDDGTGNSDHREFELAGMRGVKLGGLDNPCRHEACDTRTVSSARPSGACSGSSWASPTIVGPRPLAAPRV